jgi:hypothetical protein
MGSITVAKSHGLAGFGDVEKEPNMAIPATTYDIATITNPSSALTDFTLIVDLSRMSAAWWTANNTTDGTRGRVSKGDGITELAADWIDFDNTAETGLLRVKWSGTLASSGTQQLRIYPPNTANTAYGVSDTYGQYNAYDGNWEAYYPNGGGTDRTSNQLTLTGFGSISEGDSTGKIGKATSHNGSTQYSAANTAAILSRPATLISWFYPDTGPADMCMLGVADTTSTEDWIILSTDDANSLNEITIWERNGGTGRPYDGNYTTSAWNFAFGTLVTDSSRFVSLNNQTPVENTNTITTPSTQNSTAIGRLNDNTPGRYFDGLLQEQQIHSVVRSSDYISEEYSQTNDNATFWGTWTNVPVAGGNAPTADLQGPLVGPLGGPIMSTFF